LFVHSYLEFLWRPVRHIYDEPAKAAQLFALRLAGLKLPGFATDARGWKRDERTRDALIKQGFWSRGAPTAAGKRHVRSLTWTTFSSDLAEAVARIQECERRQWCRAGRWVPEPLISGTQWGGDTSPLAALQIAVLPGLIDNWIESRCTTQGHAFYRINADVDVESKIAESMPDEDIPSFDDEAFAVYEKHFGAVRSMFHSGALKISAAGQIGEIPLPVSMPMIDENKSYDDVDFFGPLFPVNPLNA
jgi:hypothetical protein